MHTHKCANTNTYSLYITCHLKAFSSIKLRLHSNGKSNAFLLITSKLTLVCFKENHVFL